MKHKNTLLLVVLSIISYFPLAAQEQESEQLRKKFDVEGFKKKKADFIIDKIDLTDADAKAFIPLSNELMDKRFELNRAIRRDTRELRKKANKTETDYLNLLDASSVAKIKEAQLEQEYLQKFKKVLSAEKIYKYKQAEAEYMKDMVDQRTDGDRPRPK